MNIHQNAIMAIRLVKIPIIKSLKHLVKSLIGLFIGFNLYVIGMVLLLYKVTIRQNNFLRCVQTKGQDNSFFIIN